MLPPAEATYRPILLSPYISTGLKSPAVLVLAFKSKSKSDELNKRLFLDALFKYTPALFSPYICIIPLFTAETGFGADGSDTNVAWLLV